VKDLLQKVLAQALAALGNPVPEPHLGMVREAAEKLREARHCSEADRCVDCIMALGEAQALLDRVGGKP